MPWGKAPWVRETTAFFGLPTSSFERRPSILAPFSYCLLLLPRISCSRKSLPGRNGARPRSDRSGPWPLGSRRLDIASPVKARDSQKARKANRSSEPRQSQPGYRRWGTSPCAPPETCSLGRLRIDRRHRRDEKAQTEHAHRQPQLPSKEHFTTPLCLANKVFSNARTYKGTER